MFSSKKISAIVAFGLLAACVGIGPVDAGSLRKGLSNPQVSVPSESPDMAVPAVDKIFWGALAEGIDENSNHVRGTIAAVLNYSSKKESIDAVLSDCREGGFSSCKVVGTFSGKGSCGYITQSTDGSDNNAWGSGPTPQIAYNECYAALIGGNCKIPALGGCLK